MITRVHAALAAACLVLASVIALELVPDPPPSAGAARGPALSAGARPVQPTDADADGFVADALARPLFSPTRRPAAPTPRAAPDGLPRLTGVMIGPSGRRAIFDPADGGRSIIVDEGDSVQTYRVEKIDSGVVMLTGPNGVQILRPSFAGREATRRAASPAPSNDLHPVAPSADLPPGVLPEDVSPAGGPRR